MFDFMKDLEKRRGVKIKTLGIMHEDTLFGVDSAKVQEELAKKYGYEVVVKMAYRAKTTNLDAEVGKLKAANPDVLPADLLHRTRRSSLQDRQEASTTSPA